MTIATPPPAVRPSPHRPRAARHRDLLPRLAAGGGAADADEQPRPRGGRAAGGSGGLRRLGQGGAQLGVLRGDRRDAAGGWRTTRRCWSSPASRWRCSRPTPRRPRVLIANSMLVPHWATADEFRRLEGLGLTMYGQMTAGSWIYIGTQGILQGTYETFAECARQHFGGSLAGRLTVTAGPRRHGRRPAARRHHERGRLPGGRGRPLAHRAPAAPPATWIRWRRTSRPPSSGRWPPATAARRSRSPSRQRRRSPGASGRDAASSPTRSPTRPPPTTPCRATCRTASPYAEAAAPARGRSRGLHRPLDGLDGRPRARHARAPGARARSSSTTATTCAGRRWRRA